MSVQTTDVLERLASGPKKRFSLRLGFSTGIVLTVLISALSTHVPWAYISRANVQDMAEQISEEIIRGVRREVSDMFNSAYADQRVIADAFATKAIDLADMQKREAFFLAFIKANRFYSFVAVGMDNGDFYGAQRRDEGNILAINSVYDAQQKKAQRVERLYVGKGSEFSYLKESTKENDYSSTSRVWYQMAKKAPRTDILTEPYIFANTGQPGVNTATTVEVDGKPIGVVNIAIELGRLNLYMRELKIGKTGTAFLVTPIGELLAFKESADAIKNSLDPQGLGKVDPAALAQAIPKLSDSSHPLLKIATSAITKQGLNLASMQSVQHLYVSDAKNKDGYFVTLAPSGTNGWIIGTVVPRHDFTAQIEENLLFVWLLVGAVILVACALAIWIAQKLFVRPLSVIIDQTQHVRRFELESIEPVTTRISEIHRLSNSVNQMSQGLANFGKFIPLELVKDLLSNGVHAEIGGENRTLTILFMDMVSFTTISEELGPKLVPYLGKYLSSMSDVIVKHNGTIDKYIGDAVMAFWGAPHYNEDHAVTCCRAAVECLAELETLRKEWPEKFRAGLGIRIGINSGRVIVGNIGSSKRLNYTVLGDPVNLAARLESAGKDYGVDCIIGLNTYELARYDIVTRKLDVLRVKGKTDAVPVFELLAMADTQPTEEYGWIKVFEEGLAYFLDSKYSQARECFERTIALRGEDEPSLRFIARCDAALVSPMDA